MYQLVLRGLQSTFYNMDTIFRFYLTIPISNASEKQSFSVLKRGKNNIRNFIDHDRLGTLLCMESAETKKASFDQQIDNFVKLKCRKKAS